MILKASTNENFEQYYQRFEQAIQDFYGETCRVMYFGRSNIFYFLGWAYSKIKNLKEEEAYYRKRAALFLEEKSGWHNNLGWCLLKQKRYDEAQEIFEYLIEKNSKWDLPYAANNLVRCLLAKGQYKKAIDFIDSYSGKIGKELISKSETLFKKHGAVCPVKTAEQETIFESDDEEVELQESDIPFDIGVKSEQFSSEKIAYSKLKHPISDFIFTYLNHDEAYELYFVEGKLVEQLSLASAIEKAKTFEEDGTNIHDIESFSRQALKYKYDDTTYRWRHRKMT